MGPIRTAIAAVAALALGLAAGSASGGHRTALTFAPLASGFDSPVYVTSRARRPGDALRRRAARHDQDRARTARSPARSSTSAAASSAAASRGCSRSRSIRSTRRTTASTSTTPTRAATRASSSSARRTASAGPARARQLLFVDQPYDESQRRAAPVRPERLPLRRHGRRRLGRRPGEPRAEPEEPARQAAAHQPDAEGVGLADRRLRAAQPVAVLVRPHERQPLDRRRRPGQLGRGRLPERGARRQARELRLEPVRGQRPYTTRTSRSSARAI